MFCASAELADNEIGLLLTGRVANLIGHGPIIILKSSDILIDSKPPKDQLIIRSTWIVK